MKHKVEEYIEKNWDSCIKENMQDEDTLIGMPYPYTVPAVGYFDEMYYWDTYFTNIGLLLSGRQMQAKHNVDDMLYLVDKFGFMPNGNRTYYCDRSQPPFLSVMVRDVYEYYKDKAWLRQAYETLKIEHDFWMNKRCADIGLNAYGYNAHVETPEEYADEFIRRIGYRPDESTEDLAHHFIATAESGWDISPRFRLDAYNFAPVDLNSLMYMLEENMSFFAAELKNGEENSWQLKAQKRKELMTKYMDAGDGLLLDYNFADGKHSDVLSAATFYPLFARLADKKHAEALVAKLDLLETKYGILSCEKISDVKSSFQWGYPNGWACLQYIAVIGLDNYSYKAEAKRIAENYIALVDKVFEETGNLWEKYNVVEGNINVTNEYDMPAMMGWTAGVYLGAKKYLSN